MAFHWRCYKFICHNLLYAPLLAYLYMPSRGHTHRFSRSLPPSFLLSREPTELWLSRGDGGKGRGADNRPTKRRTPLRPFPSPRNFSNPVPVHATPARILPPRTQKKTRVVATLAREYLSRATLARQSLNCGGGETVGKIRTGEGGRVRGRARNRDACRQAGGGRVAEDASGPSGRAVT